jgi:hypothetical protein
MVMGEYLFDSDWIGFEGVAAVEEGDAFGVREELRGGLKAGVTTTYDRNILTRKQWTITRSAVGQAFVFKGISAWHLQPTPG